MPSLDELPDGSRRNFVEFMFKLLLDAHRPSFEELSKGIANGDYPVTASRETIRKIYAGIGIPVEWQTVKAVVLILCALSGQDPNSCQLFHGRKNTLMGHADYLWTMALQEPPARSPCSAKRQDVLLPGSERAVPFNNNGPSLSGFSGN
jgi:hypothetical protein